MEFLRPLVDLKDFGHRKPEWAAPKHFLDNTLMARWLNRQPVPDAKRVELSTSHLENHLSGIKAHYFKAHPHNDRVLLCLDVDAHDGQTDCNELAEFVEKTWFPGTYFEPSPRGYHGYFLLDLKNTQKKDLKDIIRRLWLTMEARRKAEGFASDIDQIKGCFQSPLKDNGLWGFPKYSGRRGTLAKLPVLPEGKRSLEALKNTAVFPIEYLSYLIQVDSPRVSSTGPSGTLTLNDSIGMTYRDAPVVMPMKVDLLINQLNKVSSKEQSKIRITLIDSPLSPQWNTLYPPMQTLIESDVHALRAYQEAIDIHGTDPEGRTWQAHFIASRVQPQALACAEALAGFYTDIGFKGNAPREATIERARRVLDKRGVITAKRRIFIKAEWLPSIEKHVTTDLIKDARIWSPKFNKRALPLDSLAAVLCVMTRNIMQTPKDPRLLFSISNERQIAPFLMQCHRAGAISSALKKPEKRIACIKVLQLAGLIVLRDNLHNTLRHIPKKYGLGMNNLQYPQYVAHCRRLKVDPYHIDPACLSLPTNKL